MNNVIFNSKFSLKLKKDSDEKLYKQSRLKQNKYWIIFLSLVALVTSLLNIWQHNGFVDKQIENKGFPYLQIKLMNFSSLIINGILSLLICILRNLKIRQYLYYLQYIALGIIFFC